jgi:outer membrane protein assembly factor BamD
MVPVRRLAFFGLALVLGGCSVRKPEQFTEDKPLYEYAMKLYDKKDYEEAIPFLESLRNRFPQSPYALDVELKVADARYEKGDYAEAEVDYQTFRSLHPTNPKIPYVVYRLGLCHYKQIPKTIDRDQIHTERALEIFREVVSRWPIAPEAKEAQPLIVKCRRSLVSRDLYVASFYLKQKQYEAALVRLRELENQTEFEDLHAEATYTLGFAYYKLKETDQARRVLNSVASDTKAGEYASKAADLLKKIP